MIKVSRTLQADMENVRTMSAYGVLAGTISASINARTEVFRKGGQKMRSLQKRKTVWAYLDGKKLVNVVQAALDNNMTVDDLKAVLIQENHGHKITFKVE